jgi:hypothetical protein
LPTAQPGRFPGLDRQLELFDLALQLLRRASELGPPIARQLELQLGDLGLGVDRILGHRRDDALQCGGFVRQGFGRDRHGPNYRTSPGLGRCST